jgi:hypothetical protein
MIAMGKQLCAFHALDRLENNCGRVHGLDMEEEQMCRVHALDMEEEQLAGRKNNCIEFYVVVYCCE